MVEVYAFLAAFSVQILAMSVLYPVWFVRRVRAQATSALGERVARLYPGVDLALARERFLARYRVLNAGIAAFGLVLLGWFFSYLRSPNWDDDDVARLVGGFFIVQLLPLCLVGLFGVMGSRAIRGALLEAKRKAILQRRGLFDFVSPAVVLVAVLGYLLFVASAIYLRYDPSGFADSLKPWQGNGLIGALTLVYVANAIVMYAMLYGKKDPLQTNAGRVHTIGAAVKTGVYSCIACVVFMSLFLALKLMELQTWKPFVLSVYLVITALLCSLGLIAPPQSPEDGEPGPDSENCKPAHMS
jgi:hypothetical protein